MATNPVYDHAPFYLENLAVDATIVPAPVEPIYTEFDVQVVYDDGTSPWTPIFMRSEFDEIAGTYSYEYATDPEFANTYTLTGNAVPQGSVQSRMSLPGAVLTLTASGQALAVPPTANRAEIEFVGSGVCQYSKDGSDPLTAPFMRLQDGAFVHLEVPDLVNFQAALEDASKPGDLHVFFYFDPNQ